MGFTYSTTIACAQKWYPDKRGLITGIIVSALGFGGVVFTPIIEMLIKKYGGVGTGELSTLRVLSIIFIIVCTIGGLFIKNPPEGYAPDGYTPPAAGSSEENYDYSPGQVLKMPQFYVVTISLASWRAYDDRICKANRNCEGNGINGDNRCSSNINVQFVQHIWGWVSDKLGRKRTILFSLGNSGIIAIC